MDVPRSTDAGLRKAPAAPRRRLGIHLPENIFRYVLETSAVHQLLLLGLTIAVFLIELAPLELQRRIVNDLAKHRDFDLTLQLCLVYGAVVLAHGMTKLTMNVYRGWVGEIAVRDLRKRIRGLVGVNQAASTLPEVQGVEVSMIVAEVEPVGAFVGGCLSEPMLQAGIMLSVLAYMIHLDMWMALAAVAIFVPQLIFVPMMQGGIIRRTTSRVQILRGLSISIVAAGYREDKDGAADDARVDHVFALDMGIFKLKFTMNFLMNFCNHLQIIAAFLIGGWAVFMGQLEIGGVVAFISGVGRLNDPWGDLVSYARDVSVTNAKFRLIANAVNALAEGRAPISSTA
jgi:ABC-type multidrug transport system fused ATPase/permease subunit